MIRFLSPRIKKIFSIIPHSPDEVELRSGVWNPLSFSMLDENREGVMTRILLALDGTRSLQTLATELQVSRSKIEAVLDQLRQLQVIEETPSSSIDYYLDSAVPAFSRTTSEPKRRVHIIGDFALTKEIQGLLLHSLLPGDIKISSLDDPKVSRLFLAEDAWLMNGLDFATLVEEYWDWQDDFVVIALDRVHPILCHRWNRIAMALSIPWQQFPPERS